LISALSLFVCVSAMAATSSAGSPLVIKIQAGLPTVLDANATFCLVQANHGASDTPGWISVSCNGKGLEEDEPSTSASVANDLSAVNALILAKGLKLNSCSYANEFRPENGVYTEEHCYFTK
jgi:hypothetical protein